MDILTGRQRARSVFLTALLVLGAVGTVYDVAILRLYPVLADGGALPTIGWMAPDRQLGRRNYAGREAYEWAARRTAPSAIVQFDPHVTIQDTSAFLYASRQFAAADEFCFTGFGGDPALCPALVAKLNRIYPKAGQPALETIDTACETLPVDILVAKDTDPVWADRRSWVWMRKPIFSNAYFRLFGCRN